MHKLACPNLESWPQDYKMSIHGAVLQGATFAFKGCGGIQSSRWAHVALATRVRRHEAPSLQGLPQWPNCGALLQGGRHPAHPAPHAPYTCTTSKYPLHQNLSKAFWGSWKAPKTFRVPPPVYPLYLCKRSYTDSENSRQLTGKLTLSTSTITKLVQDGF